MEAWRSFLQAHAAIISRIDQRLSRAGLISLDWYDVLLVIVSAPDRRLRMSALSERLVLTRSNATRLVDRLEAAGLVRRVTAKEDRRGAEVLVTPAGFKAMRRAWPVYARAINELFVASLSEREVRTIGSALRRVRAGTLGLSF